MVTPDLDEVRKSIHLKKQSFCGKKYPEFTKFIEAKFPDTSCHIERLFLFFNPDVKNICPVCGGNTVFINFNKGYSKYCSPGCASRDPEVKLKKEESVKNHYGVKNPSQSKIIQRRKEDTFMKRYGVTHNSKLESNKQKIKQTLTERYGTPNYTNQEKSRKTCLERYGTEHFLSQQCVVEQISKTLTEKYGGRGFASEELKKRKELTCTHRYGDSNYSNRSKAKNTMLEKYGSETYRKLIPNKNTNIEKFIIDILDEQHIEYERNNRELLNGQELDIYIPSKKIAIECNGIYWHSDEFKANDYHFKKFKACKELGVQLITIWEDQIHRCADILESIIKSKLGIFNERIYARSCELKELSHNTCKEFLINNHLQGAINSSIKLGLYNKDELVAVMTFGKKRKCVNGVHDWELLRFCNKIGTQVIGGASKLLNHFIKKYNPNSLSSFSSNDISDGSLYEKLHFEKSTRSISYWYIKNNKRYHRFNFTKSTLVKMGYDKNKSERQIMAENNYRRIFDSGQTKWVLSN